MNGISLKELRWFSANNDEFCESDAVSIWQAILFILPYIDNDASVSFYDEIQRMETEVYEDLIERLEKKGEPLLKDDTSPNYTSSYSDWDEKGNLLLSEEQANEILPELNRSRTLVLEAIEEADNIYQQLKIEIRKSRKNEHAKIKLVEDKLRDDLERVLIKRSSLDAVFADRLSYKKEKPVVCEVDKPVTWEDITISIEFREIKSLGTNYTDGESELYIVFKTKQRILCHGTPKALKFQGKNKPKPSKLLHLLTNFGQSESQQKHLYTKKSYPVAISKLGTLLKKLTGIPHTPFKVREGNKPYTARFKLKIRTD